MSPPRSPLICLITPGHVSSTPRLVKEADALTDAGYTVHVVAGRNFPPVDSLDQAIFSRAKWTHSVVAGGRGPVGFSRRLQRMVARRLVRFSWLNSRRLVARAHHAEVFSLARSAGRVSAHLYIGHCLAGLSSAALAARAAASRYGFDAEDYHEAETLEAQGDRYEAALRTILTRQNLSGCAHCTAASPLIGQRYADQYGRDIPVTVLNVFPRSHAPVLPPPAMPISPGRPARCYWFSQTIGAHRGLEGAVAILARLHTPVELQLRGFPAPGYPEQLQRHAARCGLRRPIVFLPPAEPNEMVRLAADADLGLSVEESLPLNRAICLTNKIFAYLMAGIPQLLSNTPAQTALAADLGAAALLADLARPDDTAARIDAFLSDPISVRTARRRAWDLAQTEFCWEIEREKLLASVHAALR